MSDVVQDRPEPFSSLVKASLAVALTWLTGAGVVLALLIGGVAASIYGLDETPQMMVSLGMVGSVGLGAAWLVVMPVLVALLVMEKSQRPRVAAVVMSFVPASLLAASVPIGGWLWVLDGMSKVTWVSGPISFGLGGH